MTNQQILEKAIQKAINGGWNREYVSNDGYMIRFKVTEQPNKTYKQDYPVVIFNHDFAKALWGDSEHNVAHIVFDTGEITKWWQYHLQQMVTADDPIKYLGKNI